MSVDRYSVNKRTMDAKQTLGSCAAAGLAGVCECIVSDLTELHFFEMWPLI